MLPMDLGLKQREQPKASLTAKTEPWLVFWEPGGCLDIWLLGRFLNLSGSQGRQFDALFVCQEEKGMWYRRKAGTSQLGTPRS